LKSHLVIGCFAFLLGLPLISHAQATATASRTGVAQLGLGGSLASPDYEQKTIKGLTVYGTFDFTRHWGIEGDVHRVSLITPTDIGEDSYLLGPRYVFRRNRLSPYAKALFGLGRFKFQPDNAPETAYTYKIYSFGAGLDIQATKHINVRAIDLEYQRWPGFGRNGLTPFVGTIGIAYALR
jgi:Outer membrane protein beta-barrel domain